MSSVNVHYGNNALTANVAVTIQRVHCQHEGSVEKYNLINNSQQVSAANMHKYAIGVWKSHTYICVSNMVLLSLTDYCVSNILCWHMHNIYIMLINLCMQCVCQTKTACGCKKGAAKKSSYN